MRITFLLSQTQKQAVPTVEFCESNPTGGSFSSAIRIGQALRDKGHEVNFEENPETIADHSCDVFIAVRTWRTFLLKKKPGKVNYLWCKDDVDQPFLAPLQQDSSLAQEVFSQMTRAIFVSHYQTQRWLSAFNLPVSKVFTSTNGIPLDQYPVTTEELPQRSPQVFYASTPFRGLEFLISAWPAILRAVPEATLHIFSSIKLYDYDADDAPYDDLYAKIQKLPSCTYHGITGQKELRPIIRQCRVLAYPCVFPETSCHIAMEAMASGCVVVSTASGALPETAWRNPLVPPHEGWMTQWTFNVCRTLVDDDYYLHYARQNLLTAQHFSWKNTAEQWLQQFNTDLQHLA